MQNSLRPDLPLSLALGAGSIRGLAHVPILQVLSDAGFRIQEIVGTSVGSLVAAFYAALGMDLDAIAAAGLSLKSTHLLSWGFLRHTPPAVRDRWAHLAGIIPGHLQKLALGSFDQMHHGVKRIGIVAYDSITNAQVVCNNVDPILRLEDAVRGAAALPHLFPAWKCSFQGREYRLIDGGVKNKLPVDVLFQDPFRPVQILAVDISSKPVDRHINIERISALKHQFPNIPMDVICLDTLHGAAVVYQSGYLSQLTKTARSTALQFVSRLPSRAHAREG